MLNIVYIIVTVM